MRSWTGRTSSFGRAGDDVQVVQRAPPRVRGLAQPRGRRTQTAHPRAVEPERGTCRPLTPPLVEPVGGYQAPSPAERLGETPPAAWIDSARALISGRCPRLRRPTFRKGPQRRRPTSRSPSARSRTGQHRVGRTPSCIAPPSATSVRSGRPNRSRRRLGSGLDERVATAHGKPRLDRSPIGVGTRRWPNWQKAAVSKAAARRKRLSGFESHPAALTTLPFPFFFFFFKTDNPPRVETAGPSRSIRESAHSRAGSPGRTPNGGRRTGSPTPPGPGPAGRGRADPRAPADRAHLRGPLHARLRRQPRRDREPRHRLCDRAARRDVDVPRPQRTLLSDPAALLPPRFAERCLEGRTARTFRLASCSPPISTRLEPAPLTRSGGSGC